MCASGPIFECGVPLPIMRGRDDETGEFLGPSRSQQRRDALAVLMLAERLTGLDDGRLAALAMPEELRDLIRETRRVPSHIARKRQLQFLAKALRKQDEQLVDSIRIALDKDRETSRRETAELQQIEVWRERLLAGGDTALTGLLDAYPQADRQQLRQLIRNTRLERDAQRPPNAFRELLRVLRALMAQPTDQDSHTA